MTMRRARRYIDVRREYRNDKKQALLLEALVSLCYDAQQLRYDDPTRDGDNAERNKGFVGVCLQREKSRNADEQNSGCHHCRLQRYYDILYSND